MLSLGPIAEIKPARANHIFRRLCVAPAAASSHQRFHYLGCVALKVYKPGRWNHCLDIPQVRQVIGGFFNEESVLTKIQRLVRVLPRLARYLKMDRHCMERWLSGETKRVLPG
jgi:hypothetical protein